MSHHYTGWLGTVRDTLSTLDWKWQRLTGKLLRCRLLGRRVKRVEESHRDVCRETLCQRHNNSEIGEQNISDERFRVNIKSGFSHNFTRVCLCVCSSPCKYGLLRAVIHFSQFSLLVTTLLLDLRMKWKRYNAVGAGWGFGLGSMSDSWCKSSQRQRQMGGSRRT